jgi:alpha-N-arabinofuranosidase
VEARAGVAARAEAGGHEVKGSRSVDRTDRATVVVERDFVVGAVDARLRGSFVEHLGRTVYGGIFEPGHESADELGLRRDVLELVRGLGVSVVRYPGGNFVSGYDWKDGIGARDERSARLDLAWRTLEPNDFGLNEFVQWCRAVGTEPFLVFNLGTQGVQSACELVEYCNGSAASRWSELRRAHGFEAPHGVRLWGLGNEMDGRWQLGATSAAAYGQLAAQVSRAVKRVDPGVELVTAGSSLRSMASFPEWDRIVLEHTYDDVDYHALHQYYPANVLDEQSFAASSADLEGYLAAGVATCDYVRELKRSRRRVHLSLDEWNVNYHFTEDRAPWQVAPHFAEFHFDDRDAVVESSLFITLLKHADRVKIACQSLLVNVGGPIRTDTGGGSWTQSIYPPLAAMFRACDGATVHGTSIASPELATDAYGDVPMIDAVALVDGGEQRLTLFAVNRSLERPAELEVVARGWDPISGASCRCLTGNRVSDRGSLQPGPDKVRLLEDGTGAALELAPLGWAQLELAL